jgi:hypothetical protein
MNFKKEKFSSTSFLQCFCFHRTYPGMSLKNKKVSVSNLKYKFQTQSQLQNIKSDDVIRLMFVERGISNGICKPTSRAKGQLGSCGSLKFPFKLSRGADLGFSPLIVHIVIRMSFFEVLYKVKKICKTILLE